MMRPLYYLLGLCVLLALVFSVADAQTPSASPVVSSATPDTAQDVIDRMEARNVGLHSYTVRVHVRMRTSIPFYDPNLDGTTYYKRPDSFAVIFDRVPGYMKSVQKLFDDVGDPTDWQKDSNIRLAGTVQLNGRLMLELVLTKKIHSDQLGDTIAYVDPNTYELPQMEWHYTNGQTIVMTQDYQEENGFSVVTHQHVSGNRRIRATGDATYEQYQTNVAVDNSVFTQ